MIVEIYKAGGVETEVLGVEYKGSTQLITSGLYQSDLIKEPNTFIWTTSYKAYTCSGDNWSYNDNYNEELQGLGEVEE